MVESPRIAADDLQRLSQRLSQLQDQMVSFRAALKEQDERSSAESALASLNQQIAALRAEWREFIGLPASRK